MANCRNIRVKTPYPIVRDADTLHFTYLDTVGRPVITMKKSNLVEQHIQDFEVIGHTVETSVVAR